jgi:uncharacterized protein (DUF2235 family)
MVRRQRLVVCLDGTWNKRDDSTNVLHHFGLALKGKWATAAETVTQVKYYDEGVGTGVIDGITGGAFGFGLEENVREAYDWLVEMYHDRNEPVDAATHWDSKLADEIYIFGFSRGAYTARSLVGFISNSGLIRRGAPLSVNQLWENYCILGREREHRTAFWDRVFGQTPVSIRQITDLMCDPWNIERYEKRRAQDPAAPNIPNRVPGQLVELRPAEEVFVRWSRRVRITYLGVYDTVGAVGIDALAIPGLKSKLAMHHNMRATTLVQHSRHALAIDEHRTSFSHTPFLQYIDNGFQEDDSQSRAIQEVEAMRDGASARHEAKTYWERKAAMWRRKIEQRWFVGAHSNIGGGYPNNVLAQAPFKWLLDGARDARLESEDFAYIPAVPPPLPRDSYAEFAKPFWTHIIRGKRYYRPINPEPEIRASTKQATKDKTVRPGFSIQSINETIDDTVFDACTANPGYRPPNLFGYAAQENRKKPPTTDSRLAALATQTPKHTWVGETIAAHLMMVLWAIYAGLGLLAINDLFAILIDSPFPLSVVCVAAFLFVLVDWGESRANFALALTPGTPRRRAFLDSIYWLRTLGFVLFICGAVAAVCFLWSLGWRAKSLAGGWNEMTQIIAFWWPVPVCGAAGGIVAIFLDGAKGRRLASGLIGAAAGVVVAIAAGLLLFLLGWFFARILTPLVGPPDTGEEVAAMEAQLAGLLLLLQLAYFYFLKAFSWVGQPMSGTNLGSIWELQRRSTSKGVQEALGKWRSMLVCTWRDADQDMINGPAARTMRGTVRESLWRDVFGYVPLYFIVLTYGLWFAQNKLGWDWLKEEYVLLLPLWLLLPLTAALADYLEDICHFRYLALHKRGAVPSALLPVFAFAMTIIKFAAFTCASLLTLGALVLGSVKVAMAGELVGWRGTLALLISAFTVLVILAIPVGAILYRLRTARQ